MTSAATKHCRNCGNVLRPKPIPRGGVEAPCQFRARKFCDRRCWRDWLAEHAANACQRRVRMVEAEAAARRLFVAGDRVWYSRRFDESYGWPVRIPARFDGYTHDFGRSRVRIYVRKANGSEVLLTTQDWKLSPRAETDALLLADVPEFQMALRFCKLCEKPIPQVSPGGKSVVPATYELRRFCGPLCQAAAKRKTA